MVAKSNDIYTNKNDIDKSFKMMEVLQKETNEFVKKIKLESDKVVTQMSAMDKSSWYLYLAIAVKIYVFFVLAIFQGGLFVRHVAETNKYESV